MIRPDIHAADVQIVAAASFAPNEVLSVFQVFLANRTAELFSERDSVGAGSRLGGCFGLGVGHGCVSVPAEEGNISVDVTDLPDEWVFRLQLEYLQQGVESVNAVFGPCSAAGTTQ